jgi:hypothetical protein
MKSPPDSWKNPAAVQTSGFTQDDEERSQRRDEECEQPPGSELAESQLAAAQVQHRQDIHGDQATSQQQAHRLGIHSGLIVSFFKSRSKQAKIRIDVHLESSAH